MVRAKHRVIISSPGRSRRYRRGRKKAVTAKVLAAPLQACAPALVIRNQNYSHDGLVIRRHPSQRVSSDCSVAQFPSWLYVRQISSLYSHFWYEQVDSPVPSEPNWPGILRDPSSLPNGSREIRRTDESQP